MASILKTVEAECADRLANNALLASHNIPVHVDPQKNIVASVVAAVDKTKLLVVPLCVKAKTESDNSAGPVFEPIGLEVGVFQNPALAKGTDLDPREVCEEICSHNGLHHFKPISVPSVICCEGYEQVPDNVLNIYTCRFNFKAGLGSRFNLTQCATPVWNAGATTLICATPGAAIFYTTDGSRPTPTNGTLALGPLIALPSGSTVRAKAFLASHLDSKELKFQV